MFVKFDFGGFYEKNLLRKIHLRLKSDNNTGHFGESTFILLQVLQNILQVDNDANILRPSMPEVNSLILLTATCGSGTWGGVVVKAMRY
jgi:hypothetical protein